MTRWLCVIQKSSELFLISYSRHIMKIHSKGNMPDWTVINVESVSSKGT